jgi:hypothetical protein
MSAAVTLEVLHEHLRCMQAGLHEGDVEAVARLLATHDHDMRRFLFSEAGGSAGYAALAGLLRAQQDVEAEMRAMRDSAARQLEASQHPGRASRAYLACVEG